MRSRISSAMGSVGSPYWPWKRGVIGGGPSARAPPPAAPRHGSSSSSALLDACRLARQGDEVDAWREWRARRRDASAAGDPRAAAWWLILQQQRRSRQFVSRRQVTRLTNGAQLTRRKKHDEPSGATYDSP